MVRDAAALFELHTYVMNMHLPAGRKVLYEPDDVLDYLIRYSFEKPFEERANRGWLYYDEESDVYRLTLKGAYLMTWSLMQPFKALRRIAMRRRERAILREFEQARARE